MNEETKKKDKAYDELCKQFDTGKREWTFDEMAEIIQKQDNIPKEKIKKILESMQDEQRVI